MMDCCFDCDEPNPDFRCLRCREDVHRDCVAHHVCAEQTPDEEGGEA